MKTFGTFTAEAKLVLKAMKNSPKALKRLGTCRVAVKSVLKALKRLGICKVESNVVLGPWRRLVVL